MRSMWQNWRNTPLWPKGRRSLLWLWHERSWRRCARFQKVGSWAMTVLNMRHLTKLPPNAIYIGRYNHRIGHGSDFANSFKISDFGRADCIRKFELWLKSQDSLIARLGELQGHDLICWCAPNACHGHVLEILCSMSEQEIEEWKNGDFLLCDFVTPPSPKGSST